MSTAGGFNTEEMLKIYLPIKIGTDSEDVLSGNWLAVDELSSLDRHISSNFNVFSAFALLANRLAQGNQRKPLEIATSARNAAHIITKNPLWPRSLETDYGFKILELEVKRSDVEIKGSRYFLKPSTVIEANKLTKLMSGEPYVKEGETHYMMTLAFSAFNPLRNGKLDRTVTEIEVEQPKLSEAEVIEGKQREQQRIKEHNDQILNFIRDLCEKKSQAPLKATTSSEMISRMNQAQGNVQYNSNDRLAVLLVIFAKAKEMAAKNPSIPLKIDDITHEIEKSLNKNGYRYFNDNLLTTHAGILYRRKSNNFKKLVEASNRIHKEFNVQQDSIPVLRKGKSHRPH